jgi:hypothetical protein
MAAKTQVPSDVLGQSATTEGEDFAAKSGGLSRKGVAEVVSKALISSADEEAALNFFLADDNDVPDEIILHVTRKSANVKFVFRPIMEDELKKLQRRAAKNGEKLPSGNRAVDLVLLFRLIIIETMTAPNLQTSEMMMRYGSPEDALKKKLRPGEIEKLAEQIMELSGFSDDAVVQVDNKDADDVELAKN